MLAVVNRHEVSLVLDPFSQTGAAYSLSMPFFIFLFLAMIVGVFFGGVGAWINQGRWRQTARERALEAHQWRLRAEKLNRQIENNAQPKLPSGTG